MPSTQCRRHLYLHICLSAYLLVCISACLHICLSAYLLVCISAYLLICLSAYPLICLSAYLLIRLSAYLLICLSAYLLTCNFIWFDYSCESFTIFLCFVKCFCHFLFVFYLKNKNLLKINVFKNLLTISLKTSFVA